MAFVYAFLISGCICALTQCLSSLKVPFPLVAILLMVLGGGLCTKLGFFDWLNALSAAGLAITAVGCGNGAYNAGVALAAVGTAQPLLLTAALNVILVGLGAGVVSACTNIAMKVKLDETGEECAFALSVDTHIYLSRVSFVLSRKPTGTNQALTMLKPFDCFTKEKSSCNESKITISFCASAFMLICLACRHLDS